MTPGRLNRIKLSPFLVAILALASLSATAAERELVWSGSNLKAVKVSGSWREIGEGAASLSSVSRSATMQATLERFIIAHLNEALNNRFLNWIPRLVIGRAVFHPLQQRILNEDIEIFRGIESVSKIDLDRLQAAFVTPDAINHLIIQERKLKDEAKASTDLPALAQVPTLPAIPACSSFYVAGARSATGERILGRNLDFPGVGSTDLHSVVYLARPERGYRVLFVSPEGFPMAGISGMNEKGLVLAVHNAYTWDADPDGTPGLSLSREVLTQAASIEEAIEIYRKNPVAAGWLVHLSDRDPRTGAPRSAVIELSSKRVNYFFDQDHHSVLTNIYRTPEQKEHELFITTGAAIHNQDRLHRLESLVTDKPITVNRAIEILSDSFSPYARNQVEFSSSGIRVVDQVNSLVFLPDRLALLVADGPAPASLGAFYEFSFEQMDRGAAPRMIRGPKAALSPAIFQYADAYRLAFQQGEYDAAKKSLARAAKFATDCSFDLQAGSFALQEGSPSQALTLLKSASQCPSHSPYHQAIARFLHALAEWRSGDPLQARKDLQETQAAITQLLWTPPMEGATDIRETAGLREFYRLVHKTATILEAQLNKQNIPAALPALLQKKILVDLKVLDPVSGW